MASFAEILPVEIIDHIIDIIADDDDRKRRCETPNVKACALTCKALAFRCRRRIFRSVVLLAFDGPTLQFFSDGRRPLAHLFAKLIANKPEIADYVRELYFVLNNVKDGSLHSVPVTLEGLNRLETLGIGCDNARLYWGKLPTIWRSAFLKLMHSPTITSVILKSIGDFAVSDLVPCTSLKHLTLQGVTISEDDVFPAGKSIQLRQLLCFPFIDVAVGLLKLKFGDGTPVVNDQQLRRYYILIHWYYEGVTKSVAEALNLMTHLEDVYLSATSFYWQEALDFIPTMFLGVPIHTWKFLSIAFYMTDISRLVPGHQNVVKILRSLNTNNNIESLKLDLQFRHEDLDLIKPEDWDNLKECFIELAWPSLTQVELSVFVGSSDDDDSEQKTAELVKSSITHHLVRTNAVLKLAVYDYVGWMHLKPSLRFY